MSNLWQRMTRVLGASAHTAVDQVEEPESMMNQLQRELVQAAGQARIAVSQAMAWRGQIEQRLAKLREQTEAAAAAARNALEKDDEDMARAAIARKQRRETELADTQTQLDKADEVLSRHRERREQIARELTTLREKRAVLMQRSRFARSVSSMSTASSIPEPASEVIARMEEKVSMQEAVADSLTGVCEDADGLSTDKDTNLDTYIRDQAVDAELAKLKSQMKSQARSTQV